MFDDGYLSMVRLWLLENFLPVVYLNSVMNMCCFCNEEVIFKFFNNVEEYLMAWRNVHDMFIAKY